MDLFAAGDRVQLPQPPKSNEVVKSAISFKNSRTSSIESQAELLRLEAEREQLEVDQLRVDTEMVSLALPLF